MVHFLVKLLSPPVPPGYTGPRSHLIDHMSMLSAILFEVSSIDTIHILSMHGVVSQVLAFFPTFIYFIFCWLCS